MKRKNTIPAILSVLIMGVSANAHAQSGKELVTPFRKGTLTANLGVGFGTNYKGDYKGSSAFGSKAALEYGIWKAGPGIVSLGIEGGTSFSNESNDIKKNDFRGSTIIVAMRSAWHYGWKVPRLDTYAGISTGAGFYHYDYNAGSHFSNNDVSPVFGAFAGASYFFTPSFGVNIEAGYDISSLQAGVVFKLR